MPADFLSNQELLTRIDLAFKAITDTATMGSGALLNAQKFTRYVRTLQNETKVLPEARFLKMESDVVDIDSIGFGSRIMKPPATEGVALDPATSQGSAPTAVQQKLTAFETQAIVRLTDKTLRRNIEKANFEDTLVDMIGERAGVDLEELGIQGDENSADTFLALGDGWLIKAGRIVQQTEAQSGNFTPGAGVTTHTLDAHTAVPITPNSFTLTENGGAQVAHDDGAGLIVEDAASGVAGTIDYSSGDVTFSGLTAEQQYDWAYTAKIFHSTPADYPEDMFQRMIEAAPKTHFKRPAEWRLY